MVTMQCYVLGVQFALVVTKKLVPGFSCTLSSVGMKRIGFNTIVVVIALGLFNCCCGIFTRNRRRTVNLSSSAED